MKISMAQAQDSLLFTVGLRLTFKLWLCLRLRGALGLVLKLGLEGSRLSYNPTKHGLGLGLSLG